MLKLKVLVSVGISVLFLAAATPVVANATDGFSTQDPNATVSKESQNSTITTPVINQQQADHYVSVVNNQYVLNKAYASVTTTADYAAVSASVKTANLLVRENGLIIDEDNKLAYPAIEPRSLPDDQVYLGWDGIHEIFRSNAAVQNRVNYLNAVGTSLTASGVAAGLVGGPAGWLIGSIVGVIQFGVYNPSSQATALKEYNMKHKNDRIWMITPWKVWDYYFGVQHD